MRYKDILNELNNNKETYYKKLAEQDKLNKSLLIKNINNVSFKKILNFSSDWLTLEPIAYYHQEEGDVPYGYFKNIRIRFEGIETEYIPCFNTSVVFRFMSSENSNTFDHVLNVSDNDNAVYWNVVREVENLDNGIKNLTFDASVIFDVYEQEDIPLPILVPQFKVLVYYIPKAGLKTL